MQRIKLHEATKQFKLSNKLAMFFLEKKDVPVKSHSSTITMDQLELLRELSMDKEKFSDIIKEFESIGKKTVKKPAPAEPPKQEKPQAPPKPVKPPVLEKPKKIAEPEKPVASKPREVKPSPPPPPPKVQPKETKKAPEPKKEVHRKRPPEPKKLEPVKKTPPPPEKTVKPPVEKARPKPDVILPELIQISNFVTIKDLAEILNVKIRFIEEELKRLKKEYQSNQMMSMEDLKLLCQSLGVEVDIIPYEDYVFAKVIEKQNPKLNPRPPVVTVMGHVDHGKTTLLDTLRKTRVAAKESGGITQKIGAYKLTFNKNEVVFIDTPGHEAFTNIRARGAEVTDIVILVVAADDGVKPQTIEAINHAKSADVPMIVAINKIDKDGADPNKVKQELTKYDVLVEDWGGDVVCVEISAKENKNLESLLEMVVLVSEMQELKAYDTIPASGVILESRLDPQLGPIGTVLIQHGIVKKGDHFICGNAVGKVKTLFDDWGKPQSRSQVLAPVEIMGFGDVPEAGDRFQVVDDIERAKKVIDIRKLEEKEEKKDGAPNDGKFSIQNFFNQLEANKVKVFPLIVKSDNYGSGEVLESVLMKQSQEKLRVNIVAKGIGNINDSDILLAATAEAIVIGFNVKVSQNTLSLAKKKGVEIKLYNVIYHLIEDMEKAIKGEIEPEYVESWIGSVEVLQKFKISRIGVIAGCLVKEGKVTNKSKLKVMRNEDLVFEGEIETLKRIKDEVAEVKAGTECGIRVKNFNDIMVGDILQAFELTIKE